MLSVINQYFENQPEPIRSCMQFMRGHITGLDKNMNETWKYGMPMYCYHKKMFCYLWVHKKHGYPYIGIVEGKKINHPDLLQEKRDRMKILPLDPTQDLPMKKINAILKEVLTLYK